MAKEATKANTEKKAGAKAGEIPLMRKITAKNVMGEPIKNIAKQYEADGGVVPLYKIAGIIVRMRAVSTQYGDSVGFKGNFIVTRETDKKTWRGLEFFAPKTLEDELITAFQTREGHDPIQFGAAVGLMVDDDAQTGYVFVSEPLLEVATSDVLAGVVEKALGKETAKLLAGPAK